MDGLCANDRESRPANLRIFGALLQDPRKGQKLYSAWWWTQAGANLSPARALPCIQGKQQGNHRSERVLRKRRPDFKCGLNGLPLQFPAQPSREINRRCRK